MVVGNKTTHDDRTATHFQEREKDASDNKDGKTTPRRSGDDDTRSHHAPCLRTLKTAPCHPPLMTTRLADYPCVWRRAMSGGQVPMLSQDPEPSPIEARTAASVVMGESPEFSASASGMSSNASAKARIAYCSIPGTWDDPHAHHRSNGRRAVRSWKQDGRTVGAVATHERTKTDHCGLWPCARCETRTRTDAM